MVRTRPILDRDINRLDRVSMDNSPRIELEFGQDWFLDLVDRRVCRRSRDQSCLHGSLT